ncbi:MAG: DNA polymerase III subunit alpha [Nitrospira sp.]|jgi:error-prone DNA polymerase|nr:MAG: DNA polymerase III subunit alpha [Nitrospira sp.]
MSSPFVHLHVHSSYSPMQGVPSLETLCRAAQAQGCETLALTDTNGLYGAIRFLEVARLSGINPILGAELTTPAHRAILLAKTPNGYGNLCHILSARHSDGSFDFTATVARHRTGLVILSDDQTAVAAWHRDSPDDLFVELTPGPDMADALAFSRRSGLPPVATTRAQFLTPSDYQLHRLLRAIALNSTLSRLPDNACCRPTQWLMSPSQLERHYPHVPAALTNSRHIADTCFTDWRFNDTLFPTFRQCAAEEAFETLRTKTYEGALKRYGTVSAGVRARIEHELAVIRDKGYAQYFLVVEEIVRQAPRTCGRGSAAASIVSYCLNITHVDPIRHHLFFERFLNPGRHDPPDIDIDFPWDERDKILGWILTRYGNRSAAMVANQNTLALRAAIRETAKVYGLPATEIGRVLPLILRHAPYFARDSDRTPQAGTARLCRSLHLQDPWPDIIRWAVRLEGHFRNLSLHCGGIVLVPDEIRRYVPVEVSAKGLPVIQWEKDQAEEAGLVKIDILGNRSLAVIRDAMAAVAAHTGRQIDEATWDPLADDRTKNLIRQGDTMGCFYVESPATRLLLKKLWTTMPAAQQEQADDFEYLTIVSSIIRPAAHLFADDFIRRAHGHSYRALHPALQGVLDETFGIMVYQEDVMKVAVALGGFSIEDGDQLRKILSKKHKQRQLRDYQRQFYAGALARGAGTAVIEQMWAMIMSFAGYSFCKPHSASYAQVSFKSAFLRAHYPAEFMASVISNQGGFYSTFAYLSEARRMGLAILPPDINDSEWAYQGRARSIRVGLMQIKGLREDLVARLIARRTEQGPFRSLQDFLNQIQPDPSQARLLIKAGCFDGLAGELTRPALLWRLLAWQRQSSPGYLPIPPDYSLSRLIAEEVEVFGFPLRCHPLDLIPATQYQPPMISASDMAHHVGRSITMLGVLITEKVVHTKHGDPMEFVSFEDVTGLYDATIFPDVYRRTCHLLATNRAYVIEGVVEANFSAVTLTVMAIRRAPHRQETLPASPPAGR